MNLMNDLTEASKKVTVPSTRRVITLQGSLQYVSLNVFLNFIDSLSKNKELIVEVDVLRKDTKFDFKLFERMIENAQIKNKIIKNKPMITDTGKSLIKICEEFNLKQLKNRL